MAITNIRHQRLHGEGLTEAMLEKDFLYHFFLNDLLHPVGC